MKNITDEMFENATPDTIFAYGETNDTPGGVNWWNTGQPLRWVAVKGWNNDFAVYTGIVDWCFWLIKKSGDKVPTFYLKNLFSASEKVIARYRK